MIDELLDAAAAKGAFDLITDFAFHVPIIVASEIIGIPTGDREAFRAAFELTGRPDGAEALGGVAGRRRWRRAAGSAATCAT